MRLSYLAGDRPDLAETVKVLAQQMSTPRESSLVDLKRAVRYLIGARRLVHRYERQNVADSPLHAKVDSDWAGCPVTRRSTTGMIVMRGKHVLRHGSWLQIPISLSSAEAEFYALTKGAAYLLGTESHFGDWGIDTGLIRVLHTDSSSAKSFSSRRGLGKQRHVNTRYLWLQDQVAAGHLRVDKIKGDDNSADLLTKALSFEMIKGHLSRISCEIRE